MPEGLFKQFKGGKLADKLNFNFQKVLENICHAGQPLTETNSPSGRIITYPLPTAPAPPFIPPWKITTSLDSDGNFQFTVDIAGISILLSDPTDWTSQLAISNIGTGSTLAWNLEDDLIWIDSNTDGGNIDLTDLSGLAPAIKSLGNGDTFDPGQITDDGGDGDPTVYSQNGFKKVIAAISSDGGSPAKPVIQQLLYDNLALEINSLTSYTSNVIIAAAFPYAL